MFRVLPVFFFLGYNVTFTEEGVVTLVKHSHFMYPCEQEPKLTSMQNPEKTGTCIPADTWTSDFQALLSNTDGIYHNPCAKLLRSSMFRLY